MHGNKLYIIYVLPFVAERHRGSHLTMYIYVCVSGMKLVERAQTEANLYLFDQDVYCTMVKGKKWKESHCRVNGELVRDL